MKINTGNLIMSKSCGEALMHLLESYGVTTVFGIPGEHTLELYRGIEKSNVRAVTPRNEQGASFMADGWARVTGEPGEMSLNRAWCCYEIALFNQRCAIEED